jgi:hypothetical protein
MIEGRNLRKKIKILSVIPLLKGFLLYNFIVDFKI